MASVGTMLALIAGTMVLFAMGGVPTFTSSVVGSLYNNFESFNAGNMSASFVPIPTSASGVIAAVTAIGAGAIIVGLAVNGLFELALFSTYATILLVFCGDMVSIWATLKASGDYIGYFALAWMIPLGIVYAHSVMSWWAGRTG